MTRIVTREFPITAIFPTCSGGKSIASLVDTTVAVLRKYAGRGLGVIVVDGGSGRPERNAQCLGAVAGVRYHPCVRVLAVPEYVDVRAALCTALAAARKEFIFYTDGDGQYDVGELPSLFKLTKPDVGLVNGYTLDHHDPWRRVAVGAMYAVRFAKGLNIRRRGREVDCDFRPLIRGKLLGCAGLRSRGGAILTLGRADGQGLVPGACCRRECSH